MNEREFDELVRRHAGAVTAYARALCGDRRQAEEATQETFLRAWKYLDSFDERGSFEGWLIRICRNCVIDIANRDRRAPVPTADLVHELVDPDTTSELTDLLGRLPLPQREVLVLCRLLGYDYDSAASILGVPIGTIRSRLSRARDSLELLLRSRDTEAESA